MGWLKEEDGVRWLKKGVAEERGWDGLDEESWSG